MKELKMQMILTLMIMILILIFTLFMKIYVAIVSLMNVPMLIILVFSIMIIGLKMEAKEWLKY